MSAPYLRAGEARTRKRGFWPSQDSDASADAGAALANVDREDGDGRIEPKIESLVTHDILQAGRQDLTPAEISHPATVKLLIAECDGLNLENKRLRRIEEKYNTLRIRHATVVEALKKSRRLDAVSTICLSIGSLGLGAAPAYIVIAGALVIGMGIVALSSILVAVGVLGLLRPSGENERLHEPD